ncbi:MAG: DUF58 domain-containing protein [Steroidobacteraceae bacterium]
MTRAGAKTVWRIVPWLEARIALWARRRQGEDSLPLTLQARRIYILPTRGGAGFAALLLVMLLAGLNYGNSLALFLTFALGGFALVAMHQCHRMLLRLNVRALATRSVFAGDVAQILLTLDNTGTQARLALQGRIATDQPCAPLDLPPGGTGMLTLLLPTQVRGRLPVQRIELATTAPFGLFRAWTWLHTPLELLVYPRPAGNRAPPLVVGDLEGTRLAGQGDDEWVDLRPFRQGDSPRQVAWKAYARGAPLLVREYRALGAQTRIFDAALLHGLPLEARLAQLARWIVAAAARGERYGLILPRERVEMGSGAAHRHACLGALALFELPR